MVLKMIISCIAKRSTHNSKLINEIDVHDVSNKPANLYYSIIQLFFQKKKNDLKRNLLHSCLHFCRC